MMWKGRLSTPWIGSPTSSAARVNRSSAVGREIRADSARCSLERAGMILSSTEPTPILTGVASSGSMSASAQTRRQARRQSPT